MSTQRRESRWQRRSNTKRAGAVGKRSLALCTLRVHASASGGTAPPRTGAWLATNSLQLGYRIVQLVSVVQFLVSVVPFKDRHSTPPPGAERYAVICTSTARVVSLLCIPFSTEFASFHPTAPQIPTGRGRRAEGYDGKRDLYLQYAA